MKRIPLILFLIGVMCCSSQAQILNRFIDVTWQARNDLNSDTANTLLLPAYEANSRIRTAMSLVNRLVGDNRTNTAVPVSINTYKYGLPDSTISDTIVLAKSEIVSVQWIRSDTIKTLNRVPRASWYEQEHQSTKGQGRFLGRPSHYDYYDDTIYFHPIPSRVDTIYVTSIDNIYRLDTVTTLSSIHEDYRQAILKYVVYETAKARQHPLTAMYKQDYERLWMLLFPSFRPQNVQ